MATSDPTRSSNARTGQTVIARWDRARRRDGARPASTPQDRLRAVGLADSGVRSVSRADLTIHGKTKYVSVPYSAGRSGANYTVRGTPRIDIRQFGIQIPSYLGITFKPEVELDVRFECVDGPASAVPLPSP